MKGDLARGFGFASILIGSFGLMLGWMPYIGLIALPLAILAIFLGVIGMLAGLKSGATGMPATGFLLGVAVIAIQLWATVGVGSTYDTYVERAKAEAAAKSEAAVSDMPADHAIVIIDQQYANRNGQHLIRVAVANMTERPIESAKVEVQFQSRFGTTLHTATLEVVNHEIAEEIAAYDNISLPLGQYYIFDDIPSDDRITQVHISPLSVVFR